MINLEESINRLSINQVRILVVVLLMFSPIFMFSSPSFGSEGHLLSISYSFVGSLWFYSMDSTFREAGLYLFLLDFESSTSILIFGIPSLLYGYNVIMAIEGDISRRKANVMGMLSIAFPLFLGIINTGWYIIGWGYFLYTGPVSIFHPFGYLITKYMSNNDIDKSDRQWLLDD